MRTCAGVGTAGAFRCERDLGTSGTTIGGDGGTRLPFAVDEAALRGVAGALWAVAVRQDGEALGCAAEPLKADREFVMAAVQLHGHVYAHDSLGFEMIGDFLGRFGGGGPHFS